MRAGRLVPEYRLPNGKTPDGTFLDSFRLRHGYWEAKDNRDELERRETPTVLATGRVTVLMTHEQLAERLKMARPVVTKALTQLRSLGALSTESVAKGHIVVVSEDKLSQVAGVGGAAE